MDEQTQIKLANRIIDGVIAECDTYIEQFKKGVNTYSDTFTLITFIHQETDIAVSSLKRYNILTDKQAQAVKEKVTSIIDKHRQKMV